MIKEELFHKIDERREELSEAYEKDPACDYLSHFANHNRVKSLEDFLKLDIWGCVKCLYYIRSNKSFSIEQVDSMFDSFSSFFETLSIGSLDPFFDYCKRLYAFDQISDVIDYLDSNGLKEQLLLKKISKGNIYDSELLFQLKKIHLGDSEDNKDICLIPFFQLLEEEPFILLDILDFYRVFAEMRLDKTMIEDKFDELDFVIRRKEKRTVFDSWFQENYSIHHLIGEVNEISNYVKKVEKEVKKREKLRNDELRELDIAERLLMRGLSQDEITNAREIVRHIKNLPLKKDILQFIQDYNSIYYTQLEGEFESFSHNSKVHYQALLNDYGLFHEDIQIDSIMHNCLDDVKRMLQILQKMGIDFQYAFSILENSDLKTILKIKSYVEKGYLSVSFLNHHIDLFDTDSSQLLLFQNNIELLKNYSINPLLFQSSIYILLGDSSVLKQNLDYCVQYHLLQNFRGIGDYHFLLDRDFIHKVDRLIELGYEDILDSHLDCFNLGHFKRLEVLHTLSIPIDSYEDMKRVLGDEKTFFLSEDCLDDYIPDILPYVSEEEVSISLEELQNMLVSPRVYQIGTVLVSKEKVNRLLDEGHSLYEAIFSGLKLSKEEYEKMLSILCSNSQKKLI